MNRIVFAAVFAALFAASAAPARAQSATGVGIGTGTAVSRSQSQAVAISGQGGAGGSVVNNPSNAATINSTSSVPASQSIKNVPTVFAPGLAAAGLETCLGSISGGGGWLGTGFSFGTTIPDPGCATRLDARTLWSFGLKKAAVARLCINTDIYRSMPDICAQYLPRAQPYVASLPAPNVILSTDSSQAIEVIDGKTGAVRMCDHYDSKKLKCWHWQDDPRHRIAAAAPRKRVAAVPKVIGDGNPAAVNEQHPPDAVTSKTEK